MRLLRYQAKSCESFDGAAAIKNLAQPKGSFLWLNLEPAEKGQLEAAGRSLGLHALALEDAVHAHQRPKFEDHGRHYFLVLPALEVGESLVVRQISLFFAKGLVMSVAPAAAPGFAAAAERLQEGRAGLRELGADGLLHNLIDGVVDAYMPALEHFDERFGQLEEQISARRPQSASAGLHQLRRELFRVHRLLLSLEEALQRLYRDQEDFIRPRLQPYYKDLLDHASRSLDHVEGLREAAGDLLQLQNAILAQRSSESMRVLTIIATIFMPLSFIAGVYGMNFDAGSPWNMPELHWRYGYPFALGLMAAIALAMLAFFRKRGWIGPLWRRLFPRPGNGRRPRNGPPPAK